MSTTAAKLDLDPAVGTAGPRRSRTSGIDRALQILDHLQKEGRPATAYEIARAVHAPLSTIYVIVDDLVEKELLDRTDGGLLWLGPRLYHYGLSYARSLDLLTVATHEMHELARDSGETVQICGRDGDDMVVLAMEEGSDHFQVTSRVGTRSPLNWTASGRLLVGHLPEADRLAIFGRSATASPTGRAETDKAQTRAKRSHRSGTGSFHTGRGIRLLRRLHCRAGVRQSGCLPCDDLDRRAGCEGPSRKDPDLVALVRESAQRIEMRLGWRRSNL